MSIFTLDSKNLEFSKKSNKNCNELELVSCNRQYCNPVTAIGTYFIKDNFQWKEKLLTAYSNSNFSIVVWHFDKNLKPCKELLGHSGAILNIIS